MTRSRRVASSCAGLENAWRSDAIGVGVTPLRASRRRSPRPPHARGSGSARSIGRSSSCRAVSTADPIATSVPPPRTQSPSFFHPASPTPYAQAHSLSLRCGSRPLTIDCAAHAVGQDDRVVAATRDRREVCRHDRPVVVEAVLLEHPLHPAARHVVRAARYRPMRVFGFKRYTSTPGDGIEPATARPVVVRHFAENARRFSDRPERSTCPARTSVRAPRTRARRGRHRRQRLQLRDRDEAGVRLGAEDVRTSEASAGPAAPRRGVSRRSRASPRTASRSDRRSTPISIHSVCAGDVVGRLRRPARIEPQVRILLPLEHRLGERAVGLRGLDHPRAGGVVLAARREGRLRLVDLDLADAQDVEHLERLERIALRRRGRRTRTAARCGSPSRRARCRSSRATSCGTSRRAPCRQTPRCRRSRRSARSRQSPCVYGSGKFQRASCGPSGTSVAAD